MLLVRHTHPWDFKEIEKDLGEFQDSESSPVDIHKEGGRLIARLSLPHFAKGEIKVTANHGILEVLAEHKEKEDKKGKHHYYIHEVVRRIKLPAYAQVDMIKAAFENGALTVTMPIKRPKLT